MWINKNLVHQAGDQTKLNDLSIISHADGSGHTLFKAGLRECTSEDGIYFWIAYLLLAAYKYNKPVLL